MSTIATVVVILVSAWVGFSAFTSLSNRTFVVNNLIAYGVPESWWPWLGVAKAFGAAGLLAGLAVPGVGVAAAVGLVLYFVGAVITVIRARMWGDLPQPLLFLVPVLVAGWFVAGG